MAVYFVKKGGNNGNALTWANAKSTIQAGLNLATSAGDKVVVAPGVYNEQITGFGGSGTSGSRNELLADVNSTYSDGGATSGVTSNPVTIIYATNGYLMDVNKNYWTISGFKLVNPYTGTNGYGIKVGNGSDLGRGVIFEDCYVRGPKAFAIMYPYAGEGIEFRRCMFEGTGASIQAAKTGGFSSVADCTFIACAFAMHVSDMWGTYWGVGIDGSSSSYYTWVDFTNCLFWGHAGVVNNQQSLNPLSVNYAKATVKRSLGIYRFFCSSTYSNVSVTDSYVFNSSNGNLGTLLNWDSVQPPMTDFVVHNGYSTILAPLSYTPTGNEVWDICGREFTSSVGAMQYEPDEHNGLPLSSASNKGQLAMWAGGVTYVKYPFPAFPG